MQNEDLVDLPEVVGVNPLVSCICSLENQARLSPWLLVLPPFILFQTSILAGSNSEDPSHSVPL